MAAVAPIAPAPSPKKPEPKADDPPAPKKPKVTEVEDLTGDDDFIDKTAKALDKTRNCGAATVSRACVGTQIFNPTSMCASTVSTRGFLPCFENSTRAIDPSKNQPNRLRFD